MKADELLAETSAQITEWEQTAPLSRPEHEAAEAFTRAFAELDALMKDGTELPPAAWMEGIMLQAALVIERRYRHPSRLGSIPNENLADWLMDAPTMLRYVVTKVRETTEARS
jgi:hypothetical protein